MFRKLAAECFGTFWLVFGGCGSALIAAGFPEVGIGLLGVSLAFGLTVLTMAYALGPISGGHFNPAVSLAAFLDRRIDLVDMVGYWVMQVAGALSASALLAWVYSRQYVSFTYTNLSRDQGINELSGFVVEAVLTLVFVFAVLALGKSESPNKYIGMAGAYAVVQLVGYVMTGASVNPARSLAPALVGNIWNGFWVFIAGPALGAIVAWALYKVIVEGDVRLSDDMVAIKEDVEDEADRIEDRIEERFERRFDKDDD